MGSACLMESRLSSGSPEEDTSLIGLTFGGYLRSKVKKKGLYQFSSLFLVFPWLFEAVVFAFHIIWKHMLLMCSYTNLSDKVHKVSRQVWAARENDGFDCWGRGWCWDPWGSFTTVYSIRDAWWWKQVSMQQVGVFSCGPLTLMQEFISMTFNIHRS